MDASPKVRNCVVVVSPPTHTSTRLEVATIDYNGKVLRREEAACLTNEATKRRLMMLLSKLVAPHDPIILVIDTNDNVFLSHTLIKEIGDLYEIRDTITGDTVQGKFGGGHAGDICHRTFDYPHM